MTKLVLRNIHTDKRYEVVRYNKETGILTLKGPHTGATFEQPADKDTLTNLGYVLEQEAVAD